MIWSVQEDKQKLSDVSRLTHTPGDQVVAHHREKDPTITDTEAPQNPGYPGLVPPLEDEEFSNLMDMITKQRTTDSSSRTADLF